jgi:proline racemase
VSQVLEQLKKSAAVGGSMALVSAEHNWPDLPPGTTPELVQWYESLKLQLNRTQQAILDEVNRVRGLIK